MEEVANRYKELYDDYFYINNDYQLLYYISLAESFRKDAQGFDINHSEARVGLRDLHLPEWLLKSHILVFTYGDKFFKTKSQKGNTTLLRSKRFTKDMEKLKRYEESLIPDTSLEEMLHKYGLGRGYLRRLKSIVLYGDYPSMEVFNHNSKESKFYTDMIINKKEPSKSYVEIRIYADTKLDLLKKKDIKLLQSYLPGFRRSGTQVKRNLFRDSIYYLLRRRGLSHKLANTLIGEWGYDVFKDGAEGRKYERRFEDFTHNRITK